MLNKIKSILNPNKKIVFLKRKNGDILFFDSFNQILKAPYISKEINENLDINGQEGKSIQFGKLKYADKTGEVTPEEIYTADIVSIRLDFTCSKNPSKQDKEAFVLKEIYLNKNSFKSFLLSKEEFKEKRKVFFA